MLTTTSEIKKYHQRFFKKRSATDIITFSDSEGAQIVISVDQAKKQAKPRGLQLDQELTLLICHGILHAKGFDDIEEEDRLLMRIQEFESLAKVF